MTIEELINTAIFASKYPEKASSGQRALGQAYNKLKKLNFEELQYYFNDEDLIRLFVAIMKNNTTQTGMIHD